MAEAVAGHLRHQPVDGIGLARRNHRLRHVVRNRVLQDLGSGPSNRLHKVPFRHDAGDLAIIASTTTQPMPWLSSRLAISSRDASAFTVTTPLPFIFRIAATFILVSSSLGNFCPDRLRHSVLDWRDAQERRDWGLRGMRFAALQGSPSY